MRQLILPALLLAFTIFCLVDVVRSPNDGVRGLPKTVWVFIVLLFSLPGGVGWLLAGRPKDAALGITPRPRSRPTGRPLAPDDDPDFLRSIDRPRRIEPPHDVTTPSDPPAGTGAGGASPSSTGPTDEPTAPDEDERDDRRP